MFVRYATLFAGFVLVFAGGSIAAADWDQWRGERRDGVDHDSPALIDSLPDDGLKPVWISREELSGAKSGGWSSPIVADGRLYLYTHTKTKVANDELPPKKFPWLPPEKRTGMSDADYEQYEINRRNEDEQRSKNYRFDEVIYCLDASSGKLLWEKSVSSFYTRFPQSGTPAVANGRLYILGAGRVARCLDAGTGKEIWKQRLPGEFRDEFLQSSFVVTEGMAVVSCDHLFGLDAATGEIVWEGDPQKTRADHSSPTVWKTGDSSHVIANVAGETACFDPKTGRELWRIDSAAGNATPLVVGDTLLTYGSSRKSGLRAYRLSTDGAEHLWTFNKVADPGSSPVVVDDYVYVQGERRLACVNLEDGSSEWMENLDVDRPRYTSLIAGDGKVIYAFDSILAFAADPADCRELMKGRIDKTGLLAEESIFRGRLNMNELEKTAEGQKEAERLWRNTFNGAGPLNCATPVLANGRLYVRLEDGVACYDLRAK
ncbi:MAG: PQQ-binding-like beta-propeller repeat protein [Pirellulaceae bacterium]